VLHFPEKYRDEGNVGESGIFVINDYSDARFVVIASDEEGWDHVSVSTLSRCPTWEEMCYMKNLFFGKDDWVMQLHPPADKNISLMHTCLHLWAPNDGQKIPRPPVWMV
jgi:hypothetical protein